VVVEVEDSGVWLVWPEGVVLDGDVLDGYELDGVVLCVELPDGDVLWVELGELLG
jgi:hypothetical protein